LLTKRALLDKIGVFDPKLFMYQEDVDLCWRIRLCGYSIELESDAICYHLKNSNGLIEDNVKMPVWIFYNAHCKNRIRVLIKNYSKLNIAKRVPTAIFLVFARSWMLSLVNKKPQYLVSFVKGLFWNLYILSDTLRERWFVQSLRRKSDDEVAKYMLRFSVELSSFRMMVKNWSN
jgi:GT2 family glycosyltransferase